MGFNEVPLWERYAHQFPVREHLIYLNHAAVAPLCRPAAEAMQRLADDCLHYGSIHYDEWLAGPIRRYTRGVRTIELSTHLDTAACPVAGSYAADVRAMVRLAGGEERRFSLIYLKRYDVLKLVECMRQEDWEPVDGWRYADQHHPRLLYLFRKRAGPR